MRLPSILVQQHDAFTKVSHVHSPEPIVAAKRYYSIRGWGTTPSNIQHQGLVTAPRSNIQHPKPAADPWPSHAPKVTLLVNSAQVSHAIFQSVSSSPF